MCRRLVGVSILLAASVTVCSPAFAGWSFSRSPSPNASVQTGDMTLELQCDRIRFAPAAYEDAQDIQRKQGVSIRFMKGGSTEVGAFQAGPENTEIRIVDDYPVEIFFADRSDYDFVLDQIAQNTVLSMTMIDQDVSYGIFDLSGSGEAIEALRAACGERAAGSPGSLEIPVGVVYCGGGAIKRTIEFTILENPTDTWDARVTVNGDTIRAMTAYSYFGHSRPPRGFVFALLGEDRSEFLIFSDGDEDWLEFGDYRYSKCN
jgi:hypothetical protein